MEKIKEFILGGKEMALKLKPHCFVKTVAATDTAERLTTSNIVVPSAQIQAELVTANTGYVYIGDSEVSPTNYGLCMAAGDVASFNAEQLGWGKAQISLKDIWLRVSVNTDGVSCIYLER